MAFQFIFEHLNIYEVPNWGLLTRIFVFLWVSDKSIY